MVSWQPCVFCDVSAEKGFAIVYEDHDFVAFKDIAPAAQLHLQVIPKKHIESVRSLGKIDTELVRSMADIGDKLLDDYGVKPKKRKMGFHIPPYYSVSHLHLHVQALPYVPRFKAVKYPIFRGNGSNHKGLSWFVGVEQAIRILESGRSIGILPC